MSRPTRRAALSILLVAAALATGCSAEIPIVQQPPFYTPELKSIAVVPFRNATTGKDAGNVISDKLAAALMANGTYEVFNRNDVKALMDEADLKLAMGGDSNAAANAFKKSNRVQAILVGTVTTYSATTQQQQKQRPLYNTDRQGNRYLAGYQPYLHTRNEANVSATASLVRVSDGTTLYATAQPAKHQVLVEGEYVDRDPYACAAEATDQVVGQLVEQFAVVRKVIKVKVKEVLKIASGPKYDNEWPEEDTFTAADEKLFVVVALPDCCDRNTFRLTIVRKDGRTDLAEASFTWTRAQPEQVFVFSPKELAAKGGGPGDYELKFYSGPEPVIRLKFKIK